MSDPITEAARRRTFAIISHPDAGKTTLTEKFLLYGGALTTGAGAVKARGDRRSATSDWMELEQQRGISITSTVLQFPYRDCVVNLLDTPGHRDFSEDTYRVLAAADAAVMVLDAAKGIEPQTLKLFEVAKARQIPIITFINKWDRPGLDPLELLDQIDEKIGVTAAPGHLAGRHRRRLPRRDRPAHRPVHPLHPHRPRRHRGARGDRRRRAGRRRGGRRRGPPPPRATRCSRAMGLDYDEELFLGGELSPTFFGSAITNFGVRLLLDGVIDLAPAPVGPARRRRRAPPARRPVQRLRVQGAGQHGQGPPRPQRVHAGLLGPVRAGHGRHPRRHRQAVRHQVRPHGQRRRPRDARRGLPRRRGRPGQRHGRAGRRHPLARPAGHVPAHPELRPRALLGDPRARHQRSSSSSARASPSSTRRAWCRCCATPTSATRRRCSPPSGPMQFEVAVHRLENEFGAPVELSPTSYTVARRTDEASAAGPAVDARRRRARPVRRHPHRRVRERLLARPPHGRPARAGPRAPRGRRARRPTDPPAPLRLGGATSQTRPSSGTVRSTK